MLGAVIVARNSEPKYLMYYIATYSVASLTAFVVLHQVSKFQNGAEDTDAFKGLVKRNPLMAGAMTLALFSMAGIPPMAGFMAKYFIISNVLNEGHFVLVIVMILSSVIAMYYYLRLIMAMFTPIENAGRIVVNSTQKILFGVFSALMIILFFGASVLELIPW
jgi:NADH-quinone oxidoreductase subunit N